MKIALISYEYPPETALGGIATYVRQAAGVLSQRGHQVEVFAGGVATDSQKVATKSSVEGNIWIHRISVRDRAHFPQQVAQVFADRHQKIGFDVLEGPDCGADAAGAVSLVRDIPFVLKLHTPQYILHTIGKPPLPWQSRLRMTIGALRRGKFSYPPLGYQRETDPEYWHALDADEIAAPSQAIGDRIARDWQLDPALMAHVPYPYQPSEELLAIPCDTDTQTVTFLGRLEFRKGILDLAEAIPIILQRYPQVKFRFVGPAWNSPRAGQNMQQYITHKLRRYASALDFTGGVPLDRIPAFLAMTDICVFPSIWESFGLVCTEAMAAGRGVVASSAGGMAELLDQGNVGQLVLPHHPQQIAAAVLKLLENPDQRIQLGQQARERVLNHYSLERIGALQEASYERAIAHRAKLGCRPERSVGL